MYKEKVKKISSLLGHDKDRLPVPWGPNEEGLETSLPLRGLSDHHLQIPAPSTMSGSTPTEADARPSALALLRALTLAFAFGALGIGLFALPAQGQSQSDQKRRPDAQERQIIDVHLHALPIDFFAADVDTLFGYERPASSQALMHQTVDQLERFNVTKAITSGNSELLAKYKKAAPDRIIRSLWIPWDIKGDSLRTYLDSLDVWHEQGRFEVIGEVLTQYSGIAPSDTILDPLWTFAEREEVPVGIHVNDLPMTCPDSFTDGCTPRPLEEVLTEHPDLKVYVMHAGFPHLEDMIRLLDAYPQVYVGATLTKPKSEKYARYLKGLIEAGHGDRIMFGSDQMVWPELIRDFVRAIEGADFLTEAQKQDIFYDNAARFFGLEREGMGVSQR